MATSQRALPREASAVNIRTAKLALTILAAILIYVATNVALLLAEPLQLLDRLLISGAVAILGVIVLAVPLDRLAVALAAHLERTLHIAADQSKEGRH